MKCMIIETEIYTNLYINCYQGGTPNYITNYKFKSKSQPYLIWRVLFITANDNVK